MKHRISLWWPSRVRSSSGGFSMVELLVALGVFSILVSIAAGGFARALRTERQVASLIAANSNMALAIEQMAREIRTGFSFCEERGGIPSCATDAQGVGSELLFTNANGAQVHYRLNGETIERDLDGAGFAAITAANVSVRYLRFRLLGKDPGDGYTPRVTVALGVSPKSADPGVSESVTQLQTTVSARSIDRGE